MSAKNNVNKDHYTQAGRDRDSEKIVHSDHREAMTQQEKRIATGEAAQPKSRRAKGKQPTPPEVIGADQAQPPLADDAEDTGESEPDPAP